MTQTDVNNKPVVADFGPGHPFTGAPIIHAYSRAQAIDDGVLVDLTFMAQNRGYRWPVACTDRLWQTLISVGDDPDTTDHAILERRIGQVLNCLLMAIKAAGPERSDYVAFTILTDAGNAKAWASCHPDDDGDPCLTIMMQGES